MNKLAHWLTEKLTITESFPPHLPL